MVMLIHFMMTVSGIQETKNYDHEQIIVIKLTISDTFGLVTNYYFVGTVQEFVLGDL